MKVGVLHPGAMGETVAACLTGNGQAVYWCGDGRSDATAARAAAAGASGVASLAELAQRCDLIISVCPPSAAKAQAGAVAATGYAGLYLDANAIAPLSAIEIAQQFTGRYIDGGIVGPPAQTAGTTRLYLSGPLVDAVAGLFVTGPLEVQVVDDRLNSASALKMCYAAYTKGSIALLLATRALADAEGVGDCLQQEWDISQPGLGARLQASAAGVAPKAWRFVDEMHEIAQTFSAQGLPDDFHRGAARAYARLAGLKDQPAPDLSAVLRELLEPSA